MNANLNGNGRQSCSKCAHRSVAGLSRGDGKCPFHWEEGVWGLAKASRDFPNHPQATPQTDEQNFLSRFKSINDALDFETSVLSAVPESDVPTENYWAWLCEQFDEMEQEQP